MRSAGRISFSREFGGSNAATVVAEAVDAEHQGFDVLWVPDHLIDIRPLFSIFDAWTMLAYIGAKTARAKLGSGVTDVQKIHPAKTANIVATLDGLTQGRAILGIGSGEIMNTEPYGIKFGRVTERVERTREAIQVIKLLWSSSIDHPVNFSGQYYSLREAHLDLPPLQKPRPPIYIGAFSSPKMLGLVGEVADGWYPASWFTPEAFKERVALITDAASKTGRRIEDIDIVANVPTLVTNRDDKQQMAAVKKALKRKMLVNRYVFRVLGVEDLLEHLPRGMEYQLVTPDRGSDLALSKAVESFSIPDEVLGRGVDEMMALGTADDCVSSIERFIRAGATHIFFTNFLATRENYEKIAKEIMPRLRGT